MRRPQPGEKTPKLEEKFAVNEQITAREVRVIGHDGAQLGILSLTEALRRAEESGLDLIEVAPGATPPVCRLLDYGKLKYKEQKKAAEARKHSASQATKELRVRYNTDKHDLETKVRNARRFLEEGDKVKFSMRFRGRESTYHELGRTIFEQIAKALEDVAIVEQHPLVFGQIMSLSLAPKK